MGRPCKVILKKKLVDAEFMGIFQHSMVVSPSPMRGGHTGGVDSYPVAVVVVDGSLREFRVSDVRFEEPEGYITSMEEFEKFHKKDNVHYEPNILTQVIAEALKTSTINGQILEEEYK